MSKPNGGAKRGRNPWVSAKGRPYKFDEKWRDANPNCRQCSAFVAVRIGLCDQCFRINERKRNRE